MKKVFNKKTNLKKIILLLITGLVMSAGVMADFCTPLGGDCGYLDKSYCDGDIVVEENGYCGLSSNGEMLICRSEKTQIQNCSNIDGFHCRGNQIWEGDGYCLNASCKADWQFIENCDYYDHLYCEGSFVVGRDWYCRGGACSYKEIVQNCDDGLYCNGQETCKGGAYVAGTPTNCDDGVSCTVDSCNESADRCDYIPNNALCNDNQYCNGQETCHITNGCQPGTSVDCSANNLPAIATCTNDPDNNPFTWDYASAFVSTCDEANDRCTTAPSNRLTHQCKDNNPNDGVNGNQCGAPCDQDTDCDDSDPITVDICGSDCTCKHLIEICGNNIDDDGDGLIDCNDPDCAGQTGPQGVICCQNNNNNCNSLDADCADGVCNLQTHKCTQQFKPPTIVCRASGGACNIEEKCTGNNAKCPADQVEPATKVCRPAVSNCDVAENCDGANKACPADAYKPVGTDCGICVACDNVGNCIYDETQDNDCICPSDTCTDANNDGIIDAYNDYNVGECQAIFTCNDCGPTITEPDTRCKTIMKIPIDKGISIFSLPLIPETPKTFKDIQKGCSFTEGITDGIVYWDPLSNQENKYVYIDSNAPLYPGQGYFTTQENECQFTIEGYKFTADFLGYLGTKDIKNGWNMIGAPSDPVNDFNLIKGTCTVASGGPWGFDAANYKYVRTQKLEPGKGYYIKTTNNCNLG